MNIAKLIVTREYYDRKNLVTRECKVTLVNVVDAGDVEVSALITIARAIRKGGPAWVQVTSTTIYE